MWLNRGDTIIEVLLAITVFSLLSVGAMTIMNQGTNAAQRALEITLVRQQIDAQAEALRATQQAAAAGSTAAWQSIKSVTPPSNVDTSVTCPAEASDVANSFIMDPKNAKPYTTFLMKDINSSLSVPYAQVRYENDDREAGKPESYGIWVEHEAEAASAVPGVHTFTIRACWRGAGLQHPMNLETVVRLYDPGS